MADAVAQTIEATCDGQRLTITRRNQERVRTMSTNDYWEGRNAAFPDTSRPEHWRGYDDAQREREFRQQQRPNASDPLGEAAFGGAVLVVIGLVVLLLVALVLVAMAWAIVALAPILIGGLALVQPVRTSPRRAPVPDLARAAAAAAAVRSDVLGHDVDPAAVQPTAELRIRGRTHAISRTGSQPAPWRSRRCRSARDSARVRAAGRR